MPGEYFTKRQNCPACGASSSHDLYRAPYDASPVLDYLRSVYEFEDADYLAAAAYHIVECASCSLLFQKEIPNENLIELLYQGGLSGEDTFTADQKADDLNLYSYYAQEISTIIDFLGKHPADLSFFDFGMGWARWALLAKGFGCQISGSELSDERRQHAEANGVKFIHFEDIPANEFDYINTEQVFEHLANPLEILTQLKTALKPRGILKISVPTAIDIKRRLKLADWSAAKGSRNSLNPIAPLEHINYFPRKSLLRMAELAGLHEVRIPMRTQYKYATRWGGISRIAKNILLPVYRNILKRQNYLFFQLNHSS